MAAEIKVKEYNNPKDYQNDAKKLATQGWMVKDTSERVQRRGCLAMVTIGWNIGLLYPPKPHIVVTYTREKAGKGK